MAIQNSTVHVLLTRTHSNSSVGRFSSWKCLVSGSEWEAKHVCLLVLEYCLALDSCTYCRARLATVSSQVACEPHFSCSYHARVAATYSIICSQTHILTIHPYGHGCVTALWGPWHIEWIYIPSGAGPTPLSSHIKFYNWDLLSFNALSKKQSIEKAKSCKT